MRKPRPRTGAAAAREEINRLFSDPESLKAYHTKSHPGHAAAVQRMLALHETEGWRRRAKEHVAAGEHI